MKCDICEVGKITEVIEYEEVTYKNVTGLSKLYYANCSYCGDHAKAKHTNANKQEMELFKGMVDGDKST